jgi:hypothetical protein
VPLSAVDSVQPAIQHTREQLFTRFRWSQWTRLALVGILASELHVGGCNFGNLGSSIPNFPKKTGNEFAPSTLTAVPFPFDSAHISQHIGQFAGLIVVAMLAAFILLTVFMFINSMFRFILLDAVLQKRCSISEGWSKSRRAGGRYFLWQIVFLISTWLFLGICVGLPVGLAVAAGWATDIQQHIGRVILGVVFLLGLFGVVVLFTVVVQVLAKDFLVPLMALDDLDFADGWHHLLAMIRLEKARFAIYLLLKFALSIAAAIIFGILALIPMIFVVVPGVVAVLAGRAAGMGWSPTTISLAIILGTVLLALMIYLMALVSVPATVFFPAYALHFFAARYPKLDSLLNPAPPIVEPPVPAAPPIVESGPEQQPPPFEPPPLPPTPEPIG